MFMVQSPQHSHCDSWFANTEQRKMAANPQTEPTDGLQVHLYAAVVSIHHHHLL